MILQLALRFKQFCKPFLNLCDLPLFLEFYSLQTVDLLLFCASEGDNPSFALYIRKQLCSDHPVAIAVRSIQIGDELFGFS